MVTTLSDGVVRVFVVGKQVGAVRCAGERVESDDNKRSTHQVKESSDVRGSFQFKQVPNLRD